MPRPPELERDVQFWIRVYSEINTHSGFLHDERNLSVVYDTLRFPTDAPPTSGRAWSTPGAMKSSHALRRIAA